MNNELHLRHVHFQITRNCNLRCSFCGQWGKKGFFADGKGQEMTLDDWKKIIKELSDYKTISGISPTITVWGGEPLVSPWFDEIMLSLKKNGFKTEIITNGTKIHEHKDVIETCVDRLYVSIDGTRDIHDAVRGNGVFDRVMKNLVDLDKSKIENVTVMSVISEALIEKLSQFLDELDKVGIDELFLQDMIGLKTEEVESYKNWMKDSFGIDATEIESWENNEKICFSEQLEEKLDGIGGGYHFTINHKTHTDSAEIVCMSPFEHTHISWNGNVLYCTDFYDFSAGNVKEDSLLDIFRNEKSDVFRREILKGNCATCNHCSWRDSRG